MKDISDYLKKFKKIILSGEVSKQKALDIIAKVMGEGVVKNLEIKGRLIKINEGPVVRSEIFLKKEKIIELFKQNGLEIDDLR